VAVNDLVAAGSAIVNISWAVTLNLPQSACYRLESSLRQVLATHADTLFVVGAGNDNRDAGCTIPANLGNVLENVITVGGTSGDGRWLSSNFGAMVNIGAPALIWSPGYHVPPQLQGEYSLFEGTSGAAPQVTAVAAALKSVRPALTPRALKCILIKTADPITTDEPVGPRLNALNALRTLLDPVALGALSCPP